VMDTVTGTWTNQYQAPANAKEGSSSSSASAIASASSAASGKVGSSSTSPGVKRESTPFILSERILMFPRGAP
jgi:hypothetical protein